MVCIVLLIRPDHVKPEAWRDASDIRASDVAVYDTIVIDTGGRATDMLLDQLCRQKQVLYQE